MTKIAIEYTATFTNGERRIFLAHSDTAARAAAYSWLCAYRPIGIYIEAMTRQAA